MAAKIKVIRAGEFLHVTEDENLDLEASQQMLASIAAARNPPADFAVLLDFRRAQWRLSTGDIYMLAEVLTRLDNLKGAKIAVLVMAGSDFDKAQFFETCAVNRGGIIACFTNFEDAIQWFFESVSVDDAASGAAGEA